MRKIMIGNAAVARGAYESGVKVISAYPGTPSTEITENAAKYERIYCEWSPNEKVAAEVAVGASIAGARAMVCMKHVGVNVAADPFFTAAYTGVNGGLVILAADDPGMHSSQNEQDTRFYARASHMPMLEPSDSQEAKDFVGIAYELSEKYDTPVFVRMTTRVAHSQSFVELNEPQEQIIKPYEKNIGKYVMVPANAQKRHIVVEERMNRLAAVVSAMPINFEEIRDTTLGIVCSGAIYQYVREALPTVSVYKVGVVYPLPIEGIRNFSGKVDKLMVIEELEPFMENQLKANGIPCSGKELFGLQGEFSVNIIKQKMLGIELPIADKSLPNRPPVMCAGCPHRGVFYVLSKLKLRVCGDIGCYSLGAMAPLSALDVVLCMGASVGLAHGMEKAVGRDFSKGTVSVIGDSTFVHSGITGLINSVYNKSNTTLIILDNSTTGMTGHQEHPATGKTIRNEPTHKLDLVQLCESIGCESVTVVDAYDIHDVEVAVKKAISSDGVSVIITKKPCALLDKSEKTPLKIDGVACKNCKMCMKLGCPAISLHENKPVIDTSLCTGCGVCTKVCAFKAIR